jgi:hypothetical protein
MYPIQHNNKKKKQEKTPYWLKKEKTSIKLPVIVTHVYNPSYSGDRDVENHSSRSCWGDGTIPATWKS